MTTQIVSGGFKVSMLTYERINTYIVDVILVSFWSWLCMCLCLFCSHFKWARFSLFNLRKIVLLDWLKHIET